MTDPGIELGPFRLEAELGRGGMGTVWLARHRTQDVRVAIKVLTPSVAEDPALLAAFRNEVRAVAALHHPNVVMVLDHGEIPAHVQAPDLTPGAPYLVMEYADHGSLAPLRGRLPWGRIKQILLSLLDALAHAHARGVVHRDLKPGNVLLTGRNLRVKLTDFGLVHLTQYGRVMGRDEDTPAPLEAGTPPYMAPEQLQAEWRDSGPWTDLFALGCLAWSMATGAPPMIGMPLPVMYYRIVSRRWPDFVPLIEVPTGFREWLGRLLEPDPADRFQRAADAAWALLALPDEAAPSALDEPTLLVAEDNLPWEPPTLDALATLGLRRDLVESMLGGASVPRMPPFPETWRRPGAEPPSLRLLGAGLGLWGLRTVPFVGRERERDAIWSALDQVRRGAGPRVVLVRGAAGAGKSRLCGWITHRAHEVGGATVLTARHDLDGGADHGLAPMLLRWHQSADLLHTDPADAAAREALRKRLVDILARQGADDPLEADALLDYFAPLLENDRSTAALPSLAARHAVLTRHLGRLARERSGIVRPVVLVLDDVQWGPETLSFLEWLLHRPDEDRTPVLALATVQEDALVDQRFEQRLLNRIAAHPRATTLALPPLGDHDARELVLQLVGLDTGLADVVADRVQGNPLFAVQLIGDWVQRGVLEIGPRGFVVKSDEILPDDLTQVWTRQVAVALDGLGHEATIALELSAVLGLGVSFREWEAACAKARVRASPELVERLAARKLARIEDGGWSFVHDLFRAAILTQARDAGRLRSLHAACYDALARIWPAGTPGLQRRLAHHAAEAGRREVAVEAWLGAAREALERGDAGVAEALCDRSGQTLVALGAAPDERRRLQADALRAVALREQGRHADSEALAERLVAAAKDRHYTILAQLLACRGLTARACGDLAASRVFLRDAVDLYVGLRAPLCLAECLLALGAVVRQLGDADDALALLGRASDLFGRAGSDYGRARVQLESAVVDLMRGQSERAVERLREARRLYKRLGAREGLGLVATWAGLAALRAGDLEQAELQLAKGRERLAEIDSPRIVVVETHLARLLRERGDLSAAKAQARSALARCEALGWPVERAACHVELVACAAESNDWATWDAHLGTAVALLDELEAVDPEIAESSQRAGERALARGHARRAKVALELAHRQWTGVGRRLRALAVQRRLATIR